MNTLQTLLENYGLWAVFIAAAFEGDVTLLLTGMLVHFGLWNPWKAFAAGALGGLAGDVFYFWVGHKATRRWLTSAHGQRVIPRMDRIARKYGVWSLFFGRYVYGARIATMMFWGMRRLPALEFLLLDAINCCVWVVLFGGFGYLFSSSLELWVGRLRAVELWLLVGLLVFMALLGIRHFFADLPPDQSLLESAEELETGDDPPNITP